MKKNLLFFLVFLVLFSCETYQTRFIALGPEYDRLSLRTTVQVCFQEKDAPAYDPIGFIEVYISDRSVLEPLTLGSVVDLASREALRKGGDLLILIPEIPGEIYVQYTGEVRYFILGRKL